MEEIRVSVRNLVEFILRSGDIDNRRGTMADKDAMQMGSRPEDSGKDGGRLSCGSTAANTDRL